MTMEQYVDDFREHLQAEHASPRTVGNYGDCARAFVAFLRASYPRMGSFQRVSHDVALDYQRHLQARKRRDGRPLSSRTHAAHIKALRKLFGFLLGENAVLHNPFASLPMPREGRPLPRNILSQDEVAEMLRSMKARDPVGLRNRAIVELLYACGMRTSELCNLRIGDVDLKDQTATILHGKGDKTRIVPIGQYASHFVGEYLRRARRHMLKGRVQDPEFLFLSQRGNPFDRSSLNKCVLHAVSRLLPRAARISAYTFRHYAEFRTIPSSRETTRRHSGKRGSERARACRILGIVFWSLQALEEAQKPIPGAIATGSAIPGRGLGECLLLHRQCSLQIDLGCFNGFVPKPHSDDGPLHSPLQQIQSRRVPQYVYGNAFVAQRRAGPGGGLAVLG